jgi:hypothetical protein
VDYRTTICFVAVTTLLAVTLSSDKLEKFNENINIWSYTTNAKEPSLKCDINGLAETASKLYDQSTKIKSLTDELLHEKARCKSLCETISDREKSISYIQKQNLSTLKQLDATNEIMKGLNKNTGFWADIPTYSYFICGGIVVYLACAFVAHISANKEKVRQDKTWHQYTENIHNLKTEQKELNLKINSCLKKLKQNTDELSQDKTFLMKEKRSRGECRKHVNQYKSDLKYHVQKSQNETFAREFLSQHMQRFTPSWHNKMKYLHFSKFDSNLVNNLSKHVVDNHIGLIQKLIKLRDERLISSFENVNSPTISRNPQEHSNIYTIITPRQDGEFNTSPRRAYNKTNIFNSGTSEIYAVELNPTKYKLINIYNPAANMANTGPTQLPIWQFMEQFSMEKNKPMNIFNIPDTGTYLTYDEVFQARRGNAPRDNQIHL